MSNFSKLLPHKKHVLLFYEYYYEDSDQRKSPLLKDADTEYPPPRIQ